MMKPFTSLMELLDFNDEADGPYCFCSTCWPGGLIRRAEVQLDPVRVVDIPFWQEVVQ
jgi:hypothetical protein